MSTNQGQSWTLMAGGIGNPLIFDLITDKNVNPALPEPTPNGGGGKIVLAVPAATNNYAGERALCGLALCGRRHLDRRLRRPVRHQGLRRELDPDPTG